MRIRRLVVALVCLALPALCACTPSEVAAWLEWRAVDPAAADAHLEAVRAEAALGRCGQWFDDAIAAGFTETEWSTVDRLMYRESKCQPHAYNRSGASGLMQVMPMWADDCGGTPADLFEPSFNLRCSVHIRNVQGWQAWSTYG